MIARNPPRRGYRFCALPGTGDADEHSNCSARTASREPRAFCLAALLFFLLASCTFDASADPSCSWQWYVCAP